LREWLDAPFGYVEAFFDAIPKLQAQEDLRMMTAVALGSGRVDKRDSDRAISRMERAAGYAQKARKMTLDEIRALGIKVVEVPKNV